MLLLVPVVQCGVGVRQAGQLPHPAQAGQAGVARAEQIHPAQPAPPCRMGSQADTSLALTKGCATNLMH